MTEWWTEPHPDLVDVPKARRAPNAKEKLASALLNIQVGIGNWLIPEPLRTEGSAKEICAAVDFDHAHRFAEGGTLDPRNLFPMMRADHRAKTVGKRGDIAEVAKGKRYGAKEAEHRRRMLAKDAGELSAEIGRLKPKAKIQSRGFATPAERQAIKERFARS